MIFFLLPTHTQFTTLLLMVVPKVGIWCTLNPYVKAMIITQIDPVQLSSTTTTTKLSGFEGINELLLKPALDLNLYVFFFVSLVNDCWLQNHYLSLIHWELSHLDLPVTRKKHNTVNAKCIRWQSSSDIHFIPIDIPHTEEVHYVRSPLITSRKANANGLIKRNVTYSISGIDL